MTASARTLTAWIATFAMLVATLAPALSQAAEPQLGAILDRFGVPGERFAYGDEAPERLAFAIDPDWRGELPRTLFFDGRGGAVAVSGVLGEARVRELLGLGAAEGATR